MSLKNLVNFVFAMTAFVSIFLLGNTAQAQNSLYGSGYWGANQSCPYQVRTGSNAVDMSEGERSARAKLKKLQAEFKAKEDLIEKRQEKLDGLKEKLEKSLRSDVVEFLTSVHIENAKDCKDYKIHPANSSCVAAKPRPPTGSAAPRPGDQAAPTNEADLVKSANPVDCAKLQDGVPAVLSQLWTTQQNDGSIGGYCIGDNASNAGSVDPSICDNQNLRPGTEKNKYRQSSTSTECKRSLSEYRKVRIEIAAASDRKDFLEAQIEEQEGKIEVAQEKSKSRKTVEADCESCGTNRGYTYEAPKRDLWSILGNGALALGFGMYGYKYDKAAMEYDAQLGYQPRQGYSSAVSMAYPFAQAAIYGAVYGGAGQGGYGCAGGAGGTGGVYGAGGNPYAVGNNAYGPFANGALGGGGAFGYPNGMYGNVLGGGAYNPGFNPYGGMNGPGSLNGSGGAALCFTWPCPQQGGMYGGAGLGGNLGLGGQFGLGNGLGGNGLGGNLGLGGQFGLGNGLGGNGLGGYGNGLGGNLGLGGQFGLGNGLGGNGLGLGLGGNLGFGANNPQYQMQLLQQQQMMLQAQQQQQQQLMQYYQAQAQAQQQAYVRQQQVQQQAAQVQQEIASLQMRLQMLYSSAYTGGGLGGGSIYGGGGLIGGGYVNGSFNVGIGAGVGIGTGTGINTGTGIINNGTRGR